MSGAMSRRRESPCPGGGLKGRPGSSPPPRQRLCIRECRSPPQWPTGGRHRRAPPSPPEPPAARALTGERATRSMASGMAFWSGGHRPNPLEVREQPFTYLVIRRLDELGNPVGAQGPGTGQPIGAAALSRAMTGRSALTSGCAGAASNSWAAHRDVRAGGRARVPLPAHPWRRWLGFCPGHEGRAFHDPHAALPGQGGRSPGCVPMADRDTRGDIYEYMLGKLATHGHQTAKFRTRAHIIELMGAIDGAKPTD